LQGQKLHKEILQAKRDESLKKINEDIKKFQLGATLSKPPTPYHRMQELAIHNSSSAVNHMPEEIKEHHLQMLGMKGGNFSGRMSKKKVSAT
jgi:hypothetical protein